MPNLQLIVRLKGATPEEIQRAGEAAMAVFAKAGVTPLDAAEASFAREGWDLSGFDPDYEDYSAEQAEIAHLWDEAASAAARAGCVDWPAGAEPDRAELEIIGFPEDDEDDSEEDEAELRAMIAQHLAAEKGRAATNDEITAAYEAFMAERNAA